LALRAAAARTVGRILAFFVVMLNAVLTLDEMLFLAMAKLWIYGNQ
jgi:hypothetical protein